MTVILTDKYSNDITEYHAKLKAVEPELISITTWVLESLQNRL